ncbi:hypothetical protein EYF80_048194 [Liparis tanakae]|uniref:Uncharacterized protein n=1 Tax=Liparis tanakae TaxID=230148 RepID=A0A4Z2FLI1_9TELE|nr:hypothetical protein EYF80_048194 [Liparis tanakae]
MTSSRRLEEGQSPNQHAADEHLGERREAAHATPPPGGEVLMQLERSVGVLTSTEAECLLQDSSLLKDTSAAGYLKVSCPPPPRETLAHIHYSMLRLAHLPRINIKRIIEKTH